MKKGIIIAFIIVIVIFLLEIFNIINVTNFKKDEKTIDSCEYYLNKSMEFIYDTLKGIQVYKYEKEYQISQIQNKNIELKDKNIQLKNKLNQTDNSQKWKSKYQEMREMFINVEKENMNVISENYKLKNKPPEIINKYVGKSGKFIEFKDTIIYDEDNKTMVDLKIPYEFNYYKNGKLYKPDNIEAELIYGDAKDFNIKQTLAVKSIIIEEGNQLQAKVITDNPDVEIVNKGTFLGINKKSIKKLVRKIDPDSKVFDVNY